MYGKNDDHIAQMMELLGIFPKKFSRRCSKNKKYFALNGKLKRVQSLQQWSIKDFMIAKYYQCYLDMATQEKKQRDLNNS